MEKIPVAAIMGPTASGKTRLALALAEQLPLEIISVDSALIYRWMDIGTAKPTPEERARVPHHLIDILDPAEAYSASRFVDDVVRLVNAIRSRGRMPILVGGTMMYFNALQNGLAALPEANERVRQTLQQKWAAAPESLHRQLQQVDPEAASRIRPGDPQRLIRALEVYELTGRPLSELQRETTQVNHALKLIKVGLIPEDRSQLHAMIATRFDAMLEQGFEDEVRALYQRGDLHPGLPSIRAVGYRQMWCYLAGEYDWQTMRHKGIVATRQLAKRQLTWLRKEADLLQLNPYTLPVDVQVKRVVEYYLRNKCIT